ncbi:class I SAM-dependent methyltransferase [Antribacter gilvus]|uniref:class I SAM-dependent methyltransferase n=1 Tax=Antribacter gilvus TaxID=2304675 RepID=UPI000F776BCC|nr:class I SAM-dependent methyltransferase [Antribacter gilvus]
MSTEHLSAVVASFDQRAATYDESEMHRGLAEAVAGFVDLDARVRVVLDVATGTGLLLRALGARVTPDVRLIGVDVSPGMLAVAQEHLPHATLVVGDTTALGLPDTSVDLVTCVTALHLFEDPAAVFAEWARVLTPGGRVVTATFAAQPGTQRGPRVVNPRPYRSNHAAFESHELVADAAASAGFRLSRRGTWSGTRDRCVLAELTLEGPPS